MSCTPAPPAFKIGLFEMKIEISSGTFFLRGPGDPPAAMLIRAFSIAHLGRQAQAAGFPEGDVHIHLVGGTGPDSRFPPSLLGRLLTPAEVEALNIEFEDETKEEPDDS